MPGSGLDVLADGIDPGRADVFRPKLTFLRSDGLLLALDHLLLLLQTRIADAYFCCAACWAVDVAFCAVICACRKWSCSVSTVLCNEATLA